MQVEVSTTMTCRYGVSYILHRLPAAANIMLTQEYLHFAKQVLSSHDKANKQADLDVSASMGDMLTEMQACLKQLCGSSSVEEPEVVARLIAEKVTAMNTSSDAPSLQEDSLREVPALPSLVATCKPGPVSQGKAPDADKALQSQPHPSTIVI